ncbi:hypothetical protein [Natronorubrum daqingense]|uniref:Uncharacterized protein n=1 Tax=Natronorubrum daqingense TaxID=588898 RepID=A0A1N7FZ54_9EURY|nr:hypothetical protein [Natronorubrum daqingense]SIS05565.1 hypothetical protein SAMN05421809_3594 [Natronorubrum daqingense]
MVGRSRRNVLRIAGVSIATVSAGCASLQNLTSGETRIEGLAIHNTDYEEYTGYVLLVDGEDPVYFDSMELEPFSEEENTAGGGLFEGYPSNPGEYTLYAWLDDQSRSEWAQFDVTERDTCTKITIIVEGPDREGEVKIVSTAGCSDDEQPDG